jgi:hypothetical protein
MYMDFPRVNKEYVDQLLTSLMIVAMIKEGQKVCVRNGLLNLEVQSTGVCAAVRRWVYQDGRACTLAYIRNTVNNAIELRQNHGDKETVDNLNNGLSKSVNGLESLAVTYDTDATMTASIRVIQQRIKQEVVKSPKKDKD